MIDLAPQFNEFLKRDEAPLIRKHSFSVDQIDDFLKEAYRINSHIASLHSSLKSVRQAYLSTAPPRKTNLRSRPDQPQPLYLTDQQREAIDGDAKRLLRDLDASIRGLTEAQELHRETQQALLKKKHGFGLPFGAGLVLGQSHEFRDAEERLRQVAAHRESVIRFLRQGLQACGQTQQSMMEARLTREIEKNRSVLAKANLDAKLGSFPGTSFDEPSSPARGQSHRQTGAAQLDERSRHEPDLTDEQLQMFEKDNQDMLQHYETTLDKVRTAEKSLLEISELQSLLVGNLEVQAAHVDQLVADSLNTTENVEKGNKELKKALERPSLARSTFFAAGGLCLFVIVWDLLI